MQASFLLEEATMEELLLPLQRRDLCASALCCVGGDATEEEEGKMEQLTLAEASEEYVMSRSFFCCTLFLRLTLALNVKFRIHPRDFRKGFGF